MSKFIKKISLTAGRAPGELVAVSEERGETTKITVIDYDEKQFREKEVSSPEECFPFKETSTVTWINVDGIREPEVIEKLGTYFGLHPLVMEDILNTGQRPKLEDMENYIFVVLKMLYSEGETNDIKSEQVSIVLGKNFVISFQEQKGDVFGPLRQRIRNSKGRVRKTGPDYLAYALIDAVVDNYFIILEKMGDQIEGLEEKLLKSPEPEIILTIHSLKRETMFLRKSVWPLREVLSSLQRGESGLIKKGTGIFLRDVYDHTIQVIDTAETFRDMVSGILDIYLSSLSNKMNEVMKTLTIIATIFIPLTFFAGIYGMNFKFMPELDWRFGYFAVWGVNLFIAVCLIVYFKRKRWI